MKVISILILALHLTSIASADQEPVSEDIEIEKIETALDVSIPMLEEKEDFNVEPPEEGTAVSQKSDFSAMEETIIFADLAVIQKNYMPKSERYQLNLNFVSVPSDAFYLTGGLAIKAAYHFNETWGAEGFATFFNSDPRKEVENISTKQLVTVTNLISLKSFFGFNIYNNFIYGKLSINDKKVMPFEIYATGGIGAVTNSSNLTSPCGQLGAGAIFSTDRSQALRADLTFAIYESVTNGQVTGIESSTFLSVGYSWLWPEPDYR